MDCVNPFMEANPGLSQALQQGQVGAEARMGKPTCLRQVTAGGFVSEMLLHETFVPFQYLYRRLPVEGMYVANPQRLMTIEAGAFTVPQNMALAVAEYGFQPYRFDGFGEPVPLEAGRLPLSLGYDVNINQYRMSNLQNELLPTPPATRQAAFDGNPTAASVEDSGLVSSVLATVYGASTGPLAGTTPTSPSFVDGNPAGSALLPQTSRGIQGPSRFPFTFTVEANQAVQLRITAFGRVSLPLAFIESTVKGYLMPSTVMHQMMEVLKPCS
jgi:hypothetical protein